MKLIFKIIFEYIYIVESEEKIGGKKKENFRLLKKFYDLFFVELTKKLSYYKTNNRIDDHHEFLQV